MSIYLDNSATTRPCEAAVEQMLHAMREDFYNPSALYAPAMGPEKMMKKCREQILQSVHAPQGSRVVFVSGGTEADNLAILGQQKKCRDKRILYSAGEHPAVKEACQAVEGAQAVAVPYTREGVVDLQALEELMDESVALICIMQVNNETGAIQPLEAIGELKKRLCPQAHFHVDGVQGYLRVPFDMKACHADSYALSGHKIHAPKGIGALYVKKGVRILPRTFGGKQERKLRTGTEALPLIGAFGVAVSELDIQKSLDTVKELKGYLTEKLINFEDITINSPETATPYILNFSVKGIRSETMLHHLASKGVYVSSGSACSKGGKSHVLSALGFEDNRADSALRVSFSKHNTTEDCDALIYALKDGIENLARR